MENRKAKLVYQLDTTYTTTQWPKITPQDQEDILGLLCKYNSRLLRFRVAQHISELYIHHYCKSIPSPWFVELYDIFRAPSNEWPEESQIHTDLVNSLLSPIGCHRNLVAKYADLSKGKRSKKRKRKESKKLDTQPQESERHEALPLPDIIPHVLLGLRSVTRQLEHLASVSKPNSQPESPKTAGESANMESSRRLEKASGTPSPGGLRVIFVSRSSQPSILHAHLPILVATASASNPLSPIRLVQLPKDCEARLCASVGLPHVAFIGLYDTAPNAQPLIDYIEQHVPVVEISWIAESRKAEYLPLKVNAIQSSQPVKSK